MYFTQTLYVRLLSTSIQNFAYLAMCVAGIVIKPSAKHRIRASAMFLFHFLRKDYFKKVCVLFEGLLPYIIPVSYISTLIVAIVSVPRHKSARSP